MGKEFDYKNISGLHLELTTKCNAMCPMCNRNYKGKKRDNLSLLELNYDKVKLLLKSSFIKQLKLISLCGVYGEPLCNKDIKIIIKYFYKCNKNIQIDLYTNGSLYDEEWWADLANIMKPYNGTVIFGIDGVDETHSLHRCGTNYRKIIKNASSFINNGGNACWDFIVFKHNEHQVEEARVLSKKLRFKEFQIKKTSRFFKNLYESDKYLDSTICEYGKHPVYKNDQIEYYLELPENKKYINSGGKFLLDIVNEYGSFQNYLDNVKISCDSINNGGIFMSSTGEIFPCCTIYQQICYKTIHGVTDKRELNEYEMYKKDDLSVFNNDIETIINGKFFCDLIKSFNCKSINEGKPKSCSRTCGVNINFHKLGHTKVENEKEKK